MRVRMIRSLCAAAAAAAYLACVGDSPVAVDGATETDASSGGAPPPLTSGGAPTSSGVEPNGPELFRLEVVTEVGVGAGTVTSSPAGINCGELCAVDYPSGTTVTLTANPAPGSGFLGWDGDAISCGQQLGCELSMSAPRSARAVFAQTGTSGWTTQIGTAGPDRGAKAVVDRQGNLLIAAQYQGAFALGGNSYDPYGSGDVMLAKLSPLGKVLWVRTIGSANGDSVEAIAVDPTSGDLVVSGLYRAPVNLGGGTPLPLADEEDVYLAKYTSATGDLVWQKAVRGSNVDETAIRALAIGPDGSIAATGSLVESIDFGAGALLAPVEVATFLVKLSGGDGSVIWQKRVGGDSGGYGNGIVVDATDAITLFATFDGSANFGGATLTAAGESDAVVVHYDGGGTFAWERPISGQGTESSIAIALGVSNRINVLARVVATGPVQVAGELLYGADGGELVVTQLAPSGGLIWAQRYGGPGNQNGTALASFANGEVVVAGAFDTTFLMGANQIAFAGGTGTDSFFALLSGDTGVATWTARVGSLEFDTATAVTASGSTFYGLGHFSGQGAAILGTTLNSTGDTDVYAFAAPQP